MTDWDTTKEVMMAQHHGRRMVTTGVALAVFGVAAAFIAPARAEAIPNFARKYGIECEACHTAWPSLNAYGRDYKINGYKIPGETDIPEEYNDMISDFLQMDKTFPISAVLQLRPYDKKKGDSVRIRAGHESEIMLAGSINKSFSVFVEFEAEDEEEFGLAADAIVASWNPTAAGNVSMGYSNAFFSDPYDTLANGRRMTRSNRGPLSAQGLSGQSLRGNTQWVGGFGKAADRVFYMAGVSAGNDSPEGEDAVDFYGRVMVDVTPSIMVGGYILDGTNDTTQDLEWDFKRYGFDTQVEFGDFRANAMYLRLEDTPKVGATPGANPLKFTQNLGYVEALYVFRPSGLPMIVPVVRVDFLDDFTDLTANLQFYVKQNIKVFGEYWANLSAPSGVDKDNRFLIQIALAF